MASVFTANSSGVLVNNEAIAGVRSIQYKLVREQGDVNALGSPERIAVYYGATRVQGVIRVASVSERSSWSSATQRPSRARSPASSSSASRRCPLAMARTRAPGLRASARCTSAASSARRRSRPSTGTQENSR